MSSLFHFGHRSWRSDRSPWLWLVVEQSFLQFLQIFCIKMIRGNDFDDLSLYFLKKYEDCCIIRVSFINII